MNTKLLKELKKLGIAKDTTYGVGKRMANNIWLHKSAIDLLDQEIYEKIKNIEFDIIKINKKNKEIALIKVDDFNKNPEPIIKEVKIFNEINSNEFKIINSGKNPLIYHHKWLMVKDDYNLFNVEEATIRSLVWKKELGINKDISNRIGRIDFWKNWLIENKIEEKIELELLNSSKKDLSFDPKIWNFNKENKLLNGQSISSAQTSRKFSTGLPKSIKIIEKLNFWKENTIHLDLGCGAYFEKNDVNNFKFFLKNKNINAYGYDPYNQSYENNLNTVINTSNGKSDTITINNVLNTIKEDSIIEHILKQAQNALKKDGKIFILIYEGNESNIGCETRDGWQRNEKIDNYIEIIKKYFPNVEKKFGLFIASKKNINIENKIKIN